MASFAKCAELWPKIALNAGRLARQTHIASTLVEAWLTVLNALPVFEVVADLRFLVVRAAHTTR